MTNKISEEYTWKLYNHNEDFILMLFIIFLALLIDISLKLNLIFLSYTSIFLFAINGSIIISLIFTSFSSKRYEIRRKEFLRMRFNK